MSNVEVARKIKSGDLASPSSSAAPGVNPEEETTATVNNNEEAAITTAAPEEQQQQHQVAAAAAAPAQSTAQPTLINDNVYSSQAEPLNQQLRSELEDSRCVVGSLHQDALEDIQKWRARWNSWCDNNAQLTHEFEKGYQHAHHTGMDQNVIDDKLQLLCNVKWLEEYGSTVDGRTDAITGAPVGVAAAESINNLRAKNPNCGLQKKEDARRRLKSLAESLYPLGQMQLPEHTLEMHEFHHADPLALLKSDLGKSFTLVAGLEAQVSQTTEEREVCLRNEDISGAEQRTANILGQMTNIIKQVKDRHDKTLEALQDVTQFDSNFKTLVGSTHNAELGQELAEHKHKKQKDLEALRSDQVQFNEEQSKFQQEYVSREQQFKEKLKSNTHDQHEAWDEIMKALGKLHDLTDERDVLIDEHCTDTVQEKQRQRRVLEYTSSVETRCADLEELEKHLNAGQELLKMTNEYYGEVMTDIETANFPSKLKATQAEERMRFYDIYKRYILFAGAAVHRKEQRVENVRRLIRSTEFQIKNAMHSMDTDLPLYKSQLDGMRTTEQNLTTVIADLQIEMEENEELWKPIQELIETEDDVDVEPPNLLLQELKRDLMKSHVEAIDNLTNTEQKMLDGEKASVRKMQNACEATKTVLTERRQTRKSAKESGSPTRLNSQ